MKPDGPQSRAWAGGFTLPEVLVAMAIFLMVIAGLISSHLFGLRLQEYSRFQVQVGDTMRKVNSRLSQELRSARACDIGQGSQSSFSPASYYKAQQGHAIQIYPLPGTAVFIRYFIDDTAHTLCRMTNGSKTAVVLAEAVGPNSEFSSTDCAGTVLSNEVKRPVLALTLDFCRLRNPSGRFQANNYLQVITVEGKYSLRCTD